jgi:hypothetical protein
VSGSQTDTPDLGFTGNYTNYSYILVTFTQPDYFDHPSPAGVIAQYYWGLGADSAISTIFPASAFYQGTISDSPATIPLQVPFSLTGSTFQMYISLGLGITGNGNGGFAWDQDYSHTLDVSLSAPDGVTLDSVGGLPGTTAITAAPEPAPLAFVTAGLVGLIVRRRLAIRKSRRV